jgi:hypothetical protein
MPRIGSAGTGGPVDNQALPAMNDATAQEPGRPGGLSRRFVVLVVGIVLAGGSLLLYAPALGFGFIGYDESAVLLAHPNLYDQESLWASVREILVGYFPREEPLIVRDLTWLADVRLFGFTQPLGYHLGNVVLNAVNVVLLFAFLLHATRSLVRAAAVAAWFAVLAIHVEPVCWVMGRKDLLAACFTLLALLAQSVALRGGSPGRRWALAVAVFLLCPIAILSKFSAIVLVLVLAAHRLYAPYLDGRRAPDAPLGLRSRWRELLWLAPHLLVTLGLYVWYQRILAAFQVIGERGPSPLSLVHIKTLALLVPLSLGHTVFHLFAAGQHAISYLRPSVSLPLTAGDVAVIVAVLAGSLGLLWLTLRRRRDLAFFVLAFFLLMLPYTNVEHIGIWVADRYAYLSSFCVLALLVVGLGELWRSRRPAGRRLVAVGCAVLVLLAGYQVAQGRAHQQAFRDARAFWTYEVTRAEPSLLAFDSFAKTALGEAAAAPEGSAARAQAIAAVTAAAERGLAYYASLPWRPAPGYFSRERAHAAGLHTALGLAAGLGGRAPEERLAYHRLAYQTMPSQHTALMLAQVLFDLARRPPSDDGLARESLGYFARYLREAKSDPLRRRGLPGLLDQYRTAFPGLRAEVDRVAEESLR